VNGRGTNRNENGDWPLLRFVATGTLPGAGKHGRPWNGVGRCEKADSVPFLKSPLSHLPSPFSHLPSALVSFPLRLIAVLAGSYAIGCIVAAYYVARVKHGVDIRAKGSGNAGARNMARVYGMTDAVITLILDAAKGAIAVLLARQFVGVEWAAAAALLAAIVGHIWPAQLSFHGGKGAATALGGMLALDPLVALSVLGLGALTFALTRNFFRAGLVAIGLGAPMLWVFGHDLATVSVAAVTSLLCLVVHHPVIDAPRVPRSSG
jgi:acyl phosphate:glycerol-3-phosphate acyltransferase